SVSLDAGGLLQADCQIRNGGEEDVDFQWYAREAYSPEGYAKEAWTPVEGADGSSWQTTPEDAGKLFRCNVTAGGVTTDSGELLVGAAMVDDTDETIAYPEDVIADDTSKSYLANSDPYNETITYFQGGELTFTFQGT